jgi:hypothetical protein
VAALRPHAWPLTAILVCNVVIIALDRWYAASGSAPNFAEEGPATVLKVTETALTGVLGLLIYRALGSEYGSGRLFWLLAGLGLCWLAFDDYAQVHERLSWELEGHQAPLVTHWDDLVVLGYAVGGLVALVVFRREVLASPPVALLLCLGVATTGLMVAADSLADPESRQASIEDWANIAASALLLAAFVVKWREIADPMPASLRTRSP